MNTAVSISGRFEKFESIEFDNVKDFILYILGNECESIVFFEHDSVCMGINRPISAKCSYQHSTNELTFKFTVTLDDILSHCKSHNYRLTDTTLIMIGFYIGTDLIIPPICLDDPIPVSSISTGLDIAYTLTFD